MSSSGLLPVDDDDDNDTKKKQVFFLYVVRCVSSLMLFITDNLILVEISRIGDYKFHLPQTKKKTSYISDQEIK